jgi:hypothetical protein
MGKKYYFLLLFMTLLSILLIFNISSILEGYTNYSPKHSPADYNTSQTDILVQDTYPPIGKNQISDDTANDIWQYYPIFTLGSYDQITNNIKYPKNPDVGRCTPASMCGALYHERDLGSNYVNPLPPVSGSGTRIGYFTTNDQLIDNLS